MDLLSPQHRTQCLDGCDPTIALQHLCPHTVVSQVVWGDAVAAWADPHDIRLSNDEIQESMTSLDFVNAEYDTSPDLLRIFLNDLPQLKSFRGAGSVLGLAGKTAGNIETFDCTDTQVGDLVTAVPAKMPKLRVLSGSQLRSESHLKDTINRLQGFSGFAWPRADEYRQWLFPAPDQLSQIRLGYLRPFEVLDFLSLVPPSMIDVALQGWSRNEPAGREMVFNSDARLPPFLEGFELQDDEPEKVNREFVPLQLWRFIEPAAHRLKVLVLSAPMSPEDLTNVTRECNALEELSVSLRIDDDPTAARGLLYSNAGLPRLRRLSVFVVSASDTSSVWAALPRNGPGTDESGGLNPSREIHGRATITALSLRVTALIDVDHSITGPMLRPFAPRLTELAVRELEIDPTDLDGRTADFPLFPLLTSLTVRSHSAQNFRRILPFMPRLRCVICQRSAGPYQEEAAAPYTIRRVGKSGGGFRRRGHFDFM